MSCSNFLEVFFFGIAITEIFILGQIELNLYLNVCIEELAAIYDLQLVSK